MANWAYTSYAIEGPKETLEKIEQAILHHPVKEGSSDGWEGNILMALNGTDDWKSTSYMRGFINEEPWYEESHGALRFSAEEAWGVTDFDEELMSIFPDIKVYWITEEPGMAVYQTNDKEGKYFKDRFYVDTCIDNADTYTDNDYKDEYFETEKDAYEWIAEITKGKVSTKEEVDKFNEECGEDEFILVHKFEIV